MPAFCQPLGHLTVKPFAELPLLEWRQKSQPWRALLSYPHHSHYMESAHLSKSRVYYRLSGSLPTAANETARTVNDQPQPVKMKPPSKEGGIISQDEENQRGSG